MKIAVISDIHGNSFALDAVLEDIAMRGVDLTVNLGDVASGPMDPAGTVARLRAQDIPTISGNHDRGIGEPADKQDRVDRFAASVLGQDARDWLAALPKTLVIEDVFLCHGTPASDTEPWLDNWFRDRDTTLPDEAQVTARAAGIEQPIMLCGHTRIPRLVRLRDGRLIFNPGSVGLQMVRGAPDARYGIIERRKGRWQAALHVVPYDMESAARQAEANGFPQWREALTSGWAGPAGLFG